MNDGSGEIGRPHDPPTIHKSNEPNPDGRRFGEAIAKIAIAQICERLGFQGFHPSAIETLSDIALRYILRIGREAHFHSNLAGRTTCTLSDLIRGIEDVNTIQGFSFASDPSHSSLRSGVIRDIALYINEAEEDGSILRRLPSFPLLISPDSTKLKTSSFSQTPAAHIPPWLPPFPDPKAYTNSTPSNFDQNVKPPSNDLRLLESDATLREEKSSVSLQHQLHHWNSSPPAEDDKLRNGDEVENTSGETSFSLIEIFSPVVEAVKRVPDSDEGNSDLGKRLLLEQRRNVRLRIGIGRTMSVNEANMYSRIGGGRKGGDVHVKEVEKDERRKRAEKILKECMDNPNELVQM